MSTLDGPRKLVKTTYAHKRNRTTKNQALMNPLSSPLEILEDQEVNLTHTEMMRRILKRSRHASQSTTYDEDQDSNQTQVLERRIKRTKRSTAATQNEFSMTLDDIDSTDDSLFQTPCEEGYVYPSLILKSLVPEKMSPVPIANRILSRTTSRRLKENSSMSRTTSSRGGGLASPFASRHNSVNFSPRSKSRPKSNLRANRHSKSRTTRPALSTKSRSIASSLNDKNSAFGPNSQVPQHESVFTMNHRSHPSPLQPGQNPNPITLNRYPSSHTLTQIPQQDWLVPAKALTRTRTPDDLDMHTPPDFGIEKSKVGGSSFLADLPMAFSTPLPTRSSHLASDIRVYAPGSGLHASSRSGSSTNAIIDELQPYYGSGGFDPAENERDIYDVAMSDVPSSSRPRKPLHISGNSIISSSGDFTLGPSDFPSPSCAAAGSGIVQDDDDNRNEDTDETDSLFPTRDDAMQKERSPTTHKLIPQQKHSLLAHEIAMYPTTSPPALNLALPRSRSASFIDELMASELPVHTPTSFPEPLPVAEMDMDVEIESAEGALKALFDDMGLADEVDQDKSSKSAAALTSRTRSIDSPALIQLDLTITDNGKQKAGSARNRASTIRASDSRQSSTSLVVTGVSCASHTRRTRSGTVVGPPGSGVVVASVLSRQHNIDSSSKSQSQVRTTAQSKVADIESDDELLLKAPGWLDADLEYLGLPTHKFHSRALGPQPGEESDDELLLTGKRRYV